MSFLDDLLNRRKVQDNTARIEQEMRPLIQKANARNVQKLKSGQINREQYQRQSDSILKNQDTSVRSLGNGLIANTKKDGNFQTAINNLSSGIMSVAPQRIAGGLAEYGGTLAGVDSLRDWGTKQSQPFRDFNAISYENAGNKAVAMGSQIAGNLLTLPLAPTKTGLGVGLNAGGKTLSRAIPMATRGATAFAPQAADTSYAIRQGGGSENAQRLGGGAVGLASGVLNSVGGEKLLTPFSNKLAGTNAVSKILGSKLANSVGGRIAIAGNNEGLEEVTEQGVENLVAQKTFDPTRKLTDNLAMSYGLGAGMGGVVRGGVEMGNRPQTSLTPELQSKRNSLEIAQSKAMADGRPDIADQLGAQIQEIDNPTPGTLREQIRNAKNTVVSAYRETAPARVEPTDNELFSLTDYADVQMGRNSQEADGIPRNNLTRYARQVADKLGIDILNGSPAEIDARISDFVDSFRNSRDAGFINADPNESEAVRAVKTVAKLVKGDTNPLESLKQEGFKSAKNSGREVYAKSPDGNTQVKVRQMQDGTYKVAWTNKFKTPLGDNSIGNNKIFQNADEAIAEARTRLGKSGTTSAPKAVSETGSTSPTLKDVENSINPAALKERGGSVVSVEPSARGGEYWNIKFADGSEVMNTKIPRTQATAPNPIESLKQEARKYKSAEEFVRAQGNPVYHGTQEDNIIKSFRDGKGVRRGGVGRAMSEQADGIFFTEHPLVAKEYADIATQNIDLQNKAENIRYRKGKVVEARLDKDAKIKELPPMISGHTEAKNAVEQAKKEGYDAVRFIEKELDSYEGSPNVFKAYTELNRAPKTTIVINKDKVLTSQELTDLYTQATAPKTAQRPKDIPSYVPDDKIDAYLKSDDYIRDQEFKRMADETKSGDPFDHPDMYMNPTEDMKKNLKSTRKVSAPKTVEKTLDSKLQQAIKAKGFVDEPADDINALKMLNAVSDDSIKEVNKTKSFAEWRDMKLQQAIEDGLNTNDAQLHYNTFNNRALSETGLTLEEIYNKVKQPTPVKTVEKNIETPVAKSERLHQEKLAKNNLTQNEYAGLHDTVKELENKASELHRKVGEATQKAIEESNGKPFTQKVRKELKTMADEWGRALDDHVNALNVVRKIDGEKPITTSRNTPVKPTLQDAPKKPFIPLSQPVDNIPAVAKQVTSSSTKTKSQQSQPIQETQAVLPNQENTKDKKAQQPKEQANPTPSNDLNDSAVSSKNNPIQVNTQSIPSDEQLDNQTNQEASRPADDFEAVAANPKSKKTRVLVDAIKADTTLTESSRTAQIEGNELNYYAKKDDSGRSVGIEQFDPKNHRIEAGFVIDNNGKVLGNHIKVDDTGIQVNVGGEVVNIETIIGNPQDWDGNYRMMETMDRNMQRLAPDEKTYRRTRRFTVDHKIKSEANFRTDLKGQRQQLAERAKPVMKARPRSVSKKEYNADIFDFIEGNKTKAEITKKYGKVVSEKISTYQKETRKMYDDILERVNETFVKFGEAPVPKRKDYLTHINELNSKPSFAGEIYGQLQNSILGEGMNTTRSNVPADIAGRTENFKPRKRWNRFFQARNGGEFTKDPFKAVDAYLEPALYNIHMTESAVRARAIESAFRTAEVIRKTDAKAVSEEFGKTIEKYGKADNSNLVTGFQEWANALAGKTQRTDRQLIDSSKGSALGLRGWQTLQRIGGRGTILGNIQSVISQALNQPLTLADAGPINYVKGIATSLSGGTPIDQSNFITARATNAESDYKSRGGKILDAGGVPLQAVELAMVKLTWNSQYHKAIANGFKGNEAVMEADRTTEQVVAGRGIADKPEAYRSTAYNGLLQYTLEVSATNKKFFQDLSKTQKAEFLVATMAMNSLMGLVTGTEPLPDLLGSIFDTAGDLLDDEDERSTTQKIGGGAKDLLGESVSMNPLLTAGANTFLSQDQRKAFFGDNSSIGRFEGTAAPVQVVRNAAGAVTSAAQGKLKDARNKALKTLPYGNQAQKSLRGAEALIDGYAVDSSGNPTYSVARDPINAGKTLVFGPGAAREARGYYDKNQTSITGEKDKKAIETSSNKPETVAQIQERRLNNREDKDGNTPVSSSKGNSRDELIKRLDEDDDTLTDTEKTLAKFYKDLPKGLSEESISELAKYERLNPNSKKRLYKGVNAQIRLKTAELERDTVTGVLNTAQEFEAKKDIAKLELAKPYGENVVDMYGLSLYEIESIADQDTYDKLVAYDKDLFLNDLISKPKFKVNNGYTSKGGRGGGSGGSKKADLSAYNATKSQLDTFKQLDALLAGTRKPVTGGTKKVATRKPTLKKITVRA